MVHGSASGRLCGRCGAHVGFLSRCPRCRAPLTGRPAASVFPPRPAPPPDDPEPQEEWELPERLGPAPGWRRPPVLVGAAAVALALALTWWLVAGRAAQPSEAAGVTQVQGPALDSGVPAEDDTGVPEEEDTETPADTPATDPTAEDQILPTGSPQPTESAEPDPADPAAEQAGKMNDLLASSSSTRADLTAAIESASRCEKDGLKTIEAVTAGRRDQLAAARTLAVNALPNGEELKDSLVDALDASFDADAAFLSWARRHVASDCDGPVAKDRDYRRGLDRSKDARKAKARFAKAWRPIAETHGLTAWKPRQI